MVRDLDIHKMNSSDTRCIEVVRPVKGLAPLLSNELGTQRDFRIRIVLQVEMNIVTQLI